MVSSRPLKSPSRRPFNSPSRRSISPQVIRSPLSPAPSTVAKLCQIWRTPVAALVRQRAALAVVEVPGTGRAGLAGLHAVGGVAFEGAVGGLVDAGGGVDHRPPDPGPQEPVDGLQPAFQLAFLAALQLAFLLALQPAFQLAFLLAQADGLLGGAQLPSDRSSLTALRLSPCSRESTATPRPTFHPRLPATGRNSSSVPARPLPRATVPTPAPAPPAPRRADCAPLPPSRLSGSGAAGLPLPALPDQPRHSSARAAPGRRIPDSSAPTPASDCGAFHRVAPLYSTTCST